MTDRARFDQNNEPSLIAVSNADGTTPVSLWADPTTHDLSVDAGLNVDAFGNQKMVMENALIPVPFDQLSFSNPDGNDNYQSAAVKKNGSTVGNLTIAYDVNNIITDIHFVAV